MNLVSRIKKLEEKQDLSSKKVYFIRWVGCEWKEAESIIRQSNESVKDFQKRVLVNTKKQYIWVK